MTSLPGPNFCAACQQPIHDQFLLHVLDQTWHSHCLLCADCKEPQNESCFYRDDMILCRRDFIRRYGARCAGCNMVIEREEMVRKARNQIFHCRCFCCSVCQRTLDTGERLYVIDGKKFVCKNDYNPSKILGNAMTNRSSNDECSSDEEVDEHSDDHGDTATVSNESNSGAEENSSKGDENHLSQKRRGPRTTIKAKQLETLKAAFASTPKPTRHIREQLAAETGLNMRVIQVWFQNRRSKERRMKQMRINGNYRGNRRQRQNTSREEDESNQSMGEFMPLEPSPRFQTIQFASNPPQTSTVPLISQAPSNPPSLSTYELYGSTANSVDEMPLDFLGNPLESSTIPFWAAPSIDDFNKLTANV